MASANSFGNFPSASAFSITPSDSVELTYPIRALFVGVGGDVCGILVDDSTTVTFKNLQTGSIYPLQFKQIYDTNTNASYLIGLR